MNADTAMSAKNYAGYLFAYFTGADTADSEQVYFARSVGNDIANWQPLNGGRPSLSSDLGTRGVRDPFLLRAAGLPGERAAFYLIATDLHIWDHDGDIRDEWMRVQKHGSRALVVWESQDLLSWTHARLVEVSPSSAGNTWAPEAMFDEASNSYLVYWASKLWNDDGRSGTTYNRMLSAHTTDFVTFTRPEVWFDPGWDVIDSTVAFDQGEYFRFTKDEREASDKVISGKYISLDKSPILASSNYEFVAEGIGRAADGSLENGLERGEGPIIVRANDQSGWYLLIDEFGLRGYQLFFAPTIDSMDWQLQPLHGLPDECRHGSIVPITQEEWDRLSALV